MQFRLLGLPLRCQRLLRFHVLPRFGKPGASLNSCHCSCRRPRVKRRELEAEATAILWVYYLLGGFLVPAARVHLPGVVRLLRAVAQDSLLQGRLELLRPLPGW